MWRMHHKPPKIKYDHLDLPGIINKRLNTTAVPANIKAGMWSRQFFPTTDMSSVFLRSTLAPVTDDAVLNRSNGKINQAERAEPGSSGINPPETYPSKRTPAETSPYSSTSFTSEQVRLFP
jgi:hypothetical protein